MLQVEADSETGSKSPRSRTRITRACDQCRQARSRCDLSQFGGTCSNCTDKGTNCTTEGETRKRGPPKGYQKHLEIQLRGVDSFVNAVLSSENPHITKFVEQLSAHSKVKGVINGVRERQSKLAPGGLQLKTNVSLSPVSPLSTPTLTSHGGSGTGSDYFSSDMTTASGGIMEDEEENDDDDMNSDTASGSYLIDDDEQLHFSGQSSGLPYLSKVLRTDTSRQQGLWTLAPMSTSLKSTLSGSVLLPPRTAQAQLLEIYFQHFHIQFPVVAKSQFLRRFYAMDIDTSSDSFNLLLLSMFSISSLFLTGHGASDPLAEQYFSTTKLLLSELYHFSQPTTALSLLLLAVRELGMGNMGQAWLYLGMATRMAQDLGLHCSAYQTDSQQQLFNDDQKATRTRLWYGCVKFDRWLAMYAGRPLGIRDTEWDAKLPILTADNSEEEMNMWAPDVRAASLYIPVPARTISLFNANVHLSIIAGEILQSFYSVQMRNLIPDLPTAQKLQEQLERWYRALPSFLTITDQLAAMKVPPNLLTLHGEYWCIMILLYRPFIQHDKSQAKEYTWEACTMAAQNIHDIVRSYKLNFTLANTSPCMVYNLFHAGLIWVAALNFRPMETSFKVNLEHCLEDLMEMKETHPAASRCYTLLSGTVVAGGENTILQELGFYPVNNGHSAPYPTFAADSTSI